MARGKYAGVIDNLPRFVDANADYQTRVNDRKAAIREEVKQERIDGGWDPNAATIPVTASELTRRYAEQRARKDEIEAELSATNLELETLTQMLVDQLENEGVSTLRIAEGSAVRVQMEPYAQVEDRDKNREWAISEGLERSLMLPWQTLNAITKKRLLEGQPEPPGVKAYCKAKIVYTKG